jgi:RNA polymerase sigma factor (sigma-70 family)
VWVAPEGAALADLQAEFVEFYVREHDAQVRRAALMIGSDDIANDVVHDAMVEVYRRWTRLDQPGGYLNRAVLNGLRDHARRQAVQIRFAAQLSGGAQHPTQGEVLDDVLAGLPFNHRAAVVLRYYLGWSSDEIARALGCAPGSVRVWNERALTSMRKALQ